jgi:hypothetical protein
MEIPIASENCAAALEHRRSSSEYLNWQGYGVYFKICQMSKEVKWDKSGTEPAENYTLYIIKRPKRIN